MCEFFGIMGKKRTGGGIKMEQWQQDNRRDVVMVDIDQLVPKDHLLRKIEKVMDYDWLYERLSPYYCHGVGRDGTDPVVLIKMVLIQHLFGIPSLRQTYREIQLNVAYRWFLGYSLLDRIPHFATVSYAFCKRFPSELPTEIFEHILNKAINNRAVDPSAKCGILSSRLYPKNHRYATFNCISRYVWRNDGMPNKCWISTIFMSTTGSVPSRPTPWQ